mmetsp:Transcript_4845/g.6697  ORF Transcript_4845/g.6697 Transcript_4845/m.6697 type:complete len:151 (+) Transcript_4845:23-475(+)
MFRQIIKFAIPIPTAHGNNHCFQSQYRSFFHTTPSILKGFEDFFDPKDATGKAAVVNTGRSWTLADLRRKSFDDLHKLWFVLYKERNLLLTARLTLKRFSRPRTDADENRYIKVKRSMAAIKHVLGERKAIGKLMHNQNKAVADENLTKI